MMALKGMMQLASEIESLLSSLWGIGTLLPEKYKVVFAR
jgi:hypothetical protein